MIWLQSSWSQRRAGGEGGSSHLCYRSLPSKGVESSGGHSLLKREGGVAGRTGPRPGSPVGAGAGLTLTASLGEPSPGHARGSGRAARGELGPLAPELGPGTTLRPHPPVVFACF